MPAMRKIGPAKGYKLPPLKKDASREEIDEHKALAAAWEQVKAGGVKEVTAIGATEALQYGKGMYELLPMEAPPAPATAVLMPEEMSNDALALTALHLGIDLQKKPMKRSEIIAAVRRQLDAAVVLDDDSEGDEAGA